MSKYFQILLFLVGLQCNNYVIAQNLPIGQISTTINDPARNNRSIGVEIFYPSATSAGSNVPVAAGEFPVIVFGHGFSMNFDAYSNFWNFFVPKGFIIILPKTEVGPIPFPDHGAFGADLNFCVNYLQAEAQNAQSPFFGKIKNKTAVMGHSMGGGATFLAGASANPNITAISAFAAAETNISAIDAATNIDVPALLFAGGNDRVAPPASNIDLMYDNLNSDCKSIVTLTNASHCGFGETNFACNFGEGSSCVACTFIPIPTQHAITFRFLLPWLNFYLKEMCEEWTVFENEFDPNNSPDVTTRRSCNYSLPQVSISANGNTEFCDGESVSLESTTSANIFLWSNNATTPNITVNSSATYNVTVTDAMNCTAVSNDINISAFPIPNPEIISTNGNNLCGGNSIILSLSESFSAYSWSNAATTETISANQQGLFDVTVTDGNQCTAVAQTFEVIDEPLNPNLVVTSTSLCSGDTLVISLDEVFQFYNWSNGATTSEIQVTATDTYMVSVSNGGTCSATADVSVVFNPTPVEPDIAQQGDTAFTTAAADSYTWWLNGMPIPNSDAPTIQMNQEGKYQVEIEIDGCSAISPEIDFVIVSVSDFSSEAVKIFPNPFNDKLIILFKGGFTYTLYTISGEILDQNIAINQIELNLSAAASGLYILQIQNTTESSRQKILKL